MSKFFEYCPCVVGDVLLYP